MALLNADDPRVLAMAGRTAARVVTFGRGSRAAVRAADVQLDDRGRPGFTLVTPEGSAPVRLRLFGEHNVTNALAAAALAGELGLALPEVADGLSAAVARSRWRMEVTQRPDGVTVINDAYNASPEAMAAAIGTLAMMARGRRSFAVLGPMYELGRRVPADARAGGRAGGPGGRGRPHRGRGGRGADTGRGQGRGLLARGTAGVPDVGSAVEAATARLTPGDVVLVKAAHSAGLERVALALTGEAGPVKTILVAGAVSLVLALFGTPLAIRIFTRRGYGQAIREEGPAGTPPSAARPPWAAPSSSSRRSSGTSPATWSPGRCRPPPACW